MARKSLRDEAADMAEERHGNGLDESWVSYWAYAAAYEALEGRLRRARKRGAARTPEDERTYWLEAKRIAEEKLEELL